MEKGLGHRYTTSSVVLISSIKPISSNISLNPLQLMRGVKSLTLQQRFFVFQNKSAAVASKNAHPVVLVTPVKEEKKSPQHNVRHWLRL